MNDQWNDSSRSSSRLRGLQSILSEKVIDAQIGDRLQTRHCKRVLNIDIVWLIVGFGLFSNKSYRSIFRYCHAPDVCVPIRATLTTARKRLSADLLQTLYQGVVTLLAKSKSITPSAFYHGMRLMAIDGTLLDCPDTDANRQEFGRVENQISHGAFPKVRVVSLCEIGTRVLWRSVIRTYRQSEQKLVLPLLEYLSPGMLLLADRHFGIAPIIYPLIRQKTQFLIRVKKSQHFPAQKRLPDGTFLSTIYSHKNDRRSCRPGKIVLIVEKSMYCLRICSTRSHTRHSNWLTCITSVGTKRSRSPSGKF
jgi:Transposase DDE domain/Insertion element 4 transposase N-terminal